MEREDKHSNEIFPGPGDGNYDDLIARIGKLPEAAPPADFSTRVMSRLPALKVPWWMRFKQALGRIFSVKWTLTFTPYRWGAALMGLVVCLMILRFAGIPVTKEPPSRDRETTANLAEGIRLLESERFSEAQAWFTQHYGQASGDPAFNFYLGRTHLALEQPQAALPYLQQATKEQIDRPEYYFWLGLCHWALQAPTQEMAGYQRALDLDPEYLPAHVYAGHHYMDQRQWTRALGHYRHVLNAVPDHAEALFNSGIALGSIGQNEQENEIWRTYLTLYPTGPQALQAVRRLNTNGDFTFRSHRLGSRRVVLKTTRYGADPCQALPEDLAPMQVVGTQIMDQMPDLVLHIVGYVDGNAPLARCRVQQIKRYLMQIYPELPADHIRLSWFGVPEKIPRGETALELETSIQIFTLPVNFNSV